ncbi:hypothetical protein OU798_14660 [Prolixibacteraceae bacterium Z1-6]|uniref:DUF3575 domain-containing protein n=1 Tax=Draconibacterium aestuarii TaxID=2998507 RepID=A0A9X3FEJ7_9BACT|nr:hypothetical protein [Prolixibacteraceae bacterium Z1-6]
MYKFILLIILVSGALQGIAQEAEKDTVGTGETEAEKRVDFSVMPYLSYNRNLDFMFGAVPMMMYKINPADTISPKSLSGASVVYTTNGSYLFGLFNMFHFKEGKWRANVFAVRGDIYSQFYMEGLEPGFVEYGTKTTFISLGVKRRISKSMFAGLGYTFVNHKTDFEDDVLPQSTTRTNGLQMNLELDTRDAIYYPTRGNLANIK